MTKKPKSVDECWMIETSIKNDLWRPNTPSPNKEALLAYRKQAFTPSQVLRTRIRKWRAETVCEWTYGKTDNGKEFARVHCARKTFLHNPLCDYKTFTECPYCGGKIKVRKN